jgi:hypothetical protein
MKNFLMMHLGHPYRAIFVLTSSAQGVALGYTICRPVGASEKPCKGELPQPRVTPWVKRTPTITALKGRPKRCNVSKFNYSTSSSIIDYFNIIRSTDIPFKTYSILIIDSNTILSITIARQYFQAISRRNF